MDFNKEIYPEEMQDKLETAVKNSAENFIESKIEEESSSCKKCGSNSLEPHIEDKEKGFTEKATCKNCGNTKEFEVEPGDLRDF